MENNFLTREEASIYLTNKYKIGAYRFLAKLACVGGGPVFCKIGQRVLYRVPDLDAWAEARMSGPKASTSDVGVR